MVDVLFGTLLSVSGAFTLLTILWTAVLISGHTAHFNKPEQQIYIIRILLMAPIYAVDSWLSLYLRRESQWAMFIDIVRDCYEAYAIFSFFKLLVSYLGGQEAVQTLVLHKPPKYYTFPFSFVKLNGRQFYYRCLQGILQYVIIRPLMTIFAAVLNAIGVYGEGQFSARVGYPYIATINSISVMVALFYLVEFYQLFQLELKPHAPLPKFLIIKGVVFFTYWQSVAIVIGGWIGVVRSTNQYSKEQVEFFLNDFLVCFEMFLAALVHTYAFTYKPYACRYSDEALVGTRGHVRQGISKVRHNLGHTMAMVSNQSDIIHDTASAVLGDLEAQVEYHKMVDEEPVKIIEITPVEADASLSAIDQTPVTEKAAPRPEVILSPTLWAAAHSEEEAMVNSQGMLKATPKGTPDVSRNAAVAAEPAV